MEESPEQNLHRPRLIILLLLVIGLLGVAAFFTVHLTKQPAKNKPTNYQANMQSPPRVRLTLLATGLPNPTGIVSTGQTADKRLFVLDRSGYIRIIQPDGSVNPKPFLDISNKVLATGEMGLLGLAFSPGYADNGKFYINYIDKSHSTVVAQYLRSVKDPNIADSKSGQTVLKFKQPYDNHNGGDLAFGSNGYLYIAVGDGGNQGDPQNRAQNLNSLFGKILRIDVSSLPYKIPPSNPFVGQTNKRPEIWDFGFRNPWRISFDSYTHDFLIADVGQNKLEEVNFETANSKGGLNYGWRCYEAKSVYNPSGCGNKANYTMPVIEYNHDKKRCAITGGYVYRGTKYPKLSGKYFYGDYCNGQLFWAQKKGSAWEADLIIRTPYRITTFGRDNSGEIYLADFATGGIYSLQDASN